MQKPPRPTLRTTALAALWLCGAAPPAPYPSPAPAAQYRAASQADEIALARSAAPAAISAGAQILTLGDHGYETAVKGGNGFVCLIERSWADEPSDPEFWNPKIRGPLCLNAAAVRTVLPAYLQRTSWVLAGATSAQVASRSKAAIAAGRMRPPEVGALAYMMSKGGYLGDAAGGHWHPHVMLFLPRDAKGTPPDLGANLPGSPILGGDPGLDPAAIFFIPVAKWSDGTASVMGM